MIREGGTDPNALFARAERAFVAGDLDGARADLLAVGRAAGEHPAILHLLALVEKKAGRADASADAFRRALRLSPRDPQIRNNFANLLIAAGLLEEALEQLDGALAAAPGFEEGRVNRTIVLQRLGRPAPALAEIAPLAAARPADARVQTLHGAVLRDLHRLDEAGDAFDRALAADPRRATALAGRARVALDRGEADASARHARALAADPTNRELRLGHALAVEADGRLDEAAAMLERGVAADPFWAEGQTQLTRVRSEAGDAGDIFRTFRAAVTRPGPPVALHRAFVQVLAEAERPAEIVAHIQRTAAQVAADPVVAVHAAAAWSDTGDRRRADEAVERVAALPGGSGVAARHWLRTGRPDRVRDAFDPERGRPPADVADWAYLGLAWRLLDDARADWLLHQPGLHRATDLPFEPGELDALADTLRGLHRARAHPIGQSLRGGTQTRGNLLARGEPALRALGARLETAVAAYMAGLPPRDARHPLLRHRDDPMRIAGSWSVRLTGSGFHVQHIHPEGVLSSALYVALPDRSGDADEQAGWLELGRPPADLGLDLPPIAVVEPRPGRLALFPSYLFHGTRPFRTGERLTVAFDVAAP